jgi:acyl-coenzyme A thioesterase 13
MDNTTIPEFDISQVAGNASEHIKRQLGDIWSAKTRPLLLLNSTFGRAIGRRFKLTELSIISKADEPNKLEGRAVLEIDVAEGKRKLIYYH